MKILFATSNPHKLREANEVGKIYGMVFSQLNEPYPEIRDDDVAKIAEEGSRYVYGKAKKPVVVDDTGLFIETFNGFPGPYSAYVFKKIGCAGILKLLSGSMNRDARFVSAVGFCDKEGSKVFVGECLGRISHEMRGRQAFGYDPIFIPEKETKTFAEDDVMKQKVSHRRKSFEAFCRWFTSR